MRIDGASNTAARYDDVFIVLQVVLAEARLTLLRTTEDDDVLIPSKVVDEYTIDGGAPNIRERYVTDDSIDVREPYWLPLGHASRDSNAARCPQGPRSTEVPDGRSRRALSVCS